LGVSIKKILSVQATGWTEMGDAIEITRLCKLFEIWKTLEDRPMRILLIAAILESSIKSMIPESLVVSFSDGTQKVIIPC